MKTLRELWLILVAFWNTGNRWLRVLLIMVVAYPAILILQSLAGAPQYVIALSGLILPIIMILGLLLLWPIIIVAVAAFAKGRAVLRWLAGLVAFELLIGIYLAIVPVGNDKGLVALFTLVLVAIFFINIALGNTGKRTLQTALKIMVVIAIIITLIFFVGGRSNVKRGVAAVWKPIAGAFTNSSTSRGESPDTLRCGTDGYIKLTKSVTTVVVMPFLDTMAASDTVNPADYAPAVEPGEKDYHSAEEEGCWTDILVRPGGVSYLSIEPEGMIDVEIFYADGESSLLEDYKPMMEVTAKKKIKGVRFRNPEEPVTVRIYLSY